MAYNPINLGPTNTVNSQAVVLPSDQVAIPIIQTTSATVGGATPVYGVPADANGTMKEISAVAAQVYGWYFYNPNTTAAYVRFYDAPPTPSIGGSSEKYVLTIPPVGGANAFGVGIKHTSGIYIAVTTGRNVSTGMPIPIDYNLFIK